ncbi:Piso0_005378 [Millerozyma farinosa CBS 7064]|uniref:Piso0_005378 protein n=1 Tax=Pichia sorbitophila (strain ATCC MYA-4447 / BCRC 22081 / CBS 7064 / NBRC 10061 / NRRL Y-12695) TaxID=559304 RepID=G8Y208_PICSO|nr:Piso0_005378 [Millerozyma farinosa CBS 7064]
MSVTTMSGVCEGSLLPLAADTRSFGGGMQRHMAAACFGEVECAGANERVAPITNVASYQRYVRGMAGLPYGRPLLQAAMDATFVSRVLAGGAPLARHTKSFFRRHTQRAHAPGFSTVVVAWLYQC